MSVAYLPVLGDVGEAEQRASQGREDGELVVGPLYGGQRHPHEVAVAAETAGDDPDRDRQDEDGQRLDDGTWLLVYHESGHHFKYEPAAPKPLLSGRS